MTSPTNTHHNNSHVPVLLEAVLRYLAPKQGETYLDLTAGYGGHAQAVLSKVGDASRLTLVDRDGSAIKSLQPLQRAGARVIHQDYAQATQALQAAGKQFDMILLDLGVSSPQLDQASRGFSFRLEAPLDMRMDPRQRLTAAEIVNSYSLQQLAEILRNYGEEPRAQQIAQVILAGRPLETTRQLANLVEAIVGRRGKIHPATRTFQALRIAVNAELDQLEQTLSRLPDLVNPGGRLAIISFHSLEDRLVKRLMVEQAAAGYEARLRVLTKRPIQATTETVFNPRARSAKLRAAVKINT